MTSKNSTHEIVLNVELSDLLNKLGFETNPEEKQTFIDIITKIEGVHIAIECKIGKNNRKAVFNQAVKRLKSKTANAAIALYYPDKLKREEVINAKLCYTVILNDKQSYKNSLWFGNNYVEISDVIRMLPGAMREEGIANELSKVLDIAVKRLSLDTRKKVSFVMDPEYSKLADTKKASDSKWNISTKRALLILASAMMFHEKFIAVSNNESSRNSSNIQSASMCGESKTPHNDFCVAWGKILEIDYKPIFETAVAILKALPKSEQDTKSALVLISNISLKVLEQTSNPTYDVFGRIFHLVLDTARHDGSFYTSIPGATLLADVLMGGESTYSHKKKIPKIIDPSCGTGTLLVAAGKHLRAKGFPVNSLIEKGLIGLDINLTATHMAATTLGLISPSTAFKRMNIYWAPLGVFEEGKEKDKNAKLGSLSFIDNKTRYLTIFGHPTASQVEKRTTIRKIPTVDYVIMNPPFTRDSLRYGQFNDADKRMIQQQENILSQKYPDIDSSNLVGFFMHLAIDKLLDSKGSNKLGCVIPASAQNAPSALEMRKYIAEKMQIDYIITSFDPQRVYFSENTGITEFLLICSSKKKKPLPTKAIYLMRNPDFGYEATILAKRLCKNENIDEWGFTEDISPNVINSGQWAFANFGSELLTNNFLELQKVTTTLDKVADVKPDGRQIRGSFVKTNKITDKQILWEHDSNYVKQLEPLPNQYILAKPKSKRKAISDLWNKRSNMLITLKIRPMTMSLIAVRLKESTLSSSWVPCHFKGITSAEELEKLEKAFTIYINSTLGILTLYAIRTNRVHIYPQFSINGLSRLSVPFIPQYQTKISDNEEEDDKNKKIIFDQKSINILAKVFDDNAKSILKPLSSMNNDPVRKRFDTAIAEISSGIFTIKKINQIRTVLEKMPYITDMRHPGYNNIVLSVTNKHKRDVKYDIK